MKSTSIGLDLDRAGPASFETPLRGCSQDEVIHLRRARNVRPSWWGARLRRASPADASHRRANH